jgi:hypothetical protein
VTLRLVTDNTRTIGTPEDEWRRLRNEVELSEESTSDFASGLKVGLWIGCVGGSFLTVGLAWVWTVVGSL